MYVPLCTVALTDVYKLPSDGGSGSSHINHSRRGVPHFQSSSAALTASFLAHWRQMRFFVYLNRSYFLIIVKWSTVVVFSSTQCATCRAVFSFFP